jgi:methylmalonyl-CoA/ethylmalonyl-CoA epimerase
MITGVDHVVIAVKDMEAAIKQFESIYSQPVGERGEPAGAGFTNAFFRFSSGSFVELVSPTSDQGPVGKRIATGGEGVYLMALAVDDMQATLADLRGKGVRLIGDPGEGNPVKGQVFIHPSAAGGVLTQLVQKK